MFRKSQYKAIDLFNARPGPMPFKFDNFYSKIPRLYNFESNKIESWWRRVIKMCAGAIYPTVCGIQVESPSERPSNGRQIRKLQVAKMRIKEK